ncbi:hypothetical protein LPJ61_002023 [Coemansia biformis]|uniref:SAGA-associated factor 11 n=1 Tax=Coemansia biformis TaxID=1286918 RepID=A0A9W8CXK8_9FUNG|nr:hypothetical protein LPJ61_002023 [Coemansia biformis]
MKAKADGSGGGGGIGGPAVFDELLQHYEDRIDALRRARESLEVARPAAAPPPGSSSGGPSSRALLGLALYQEVVDELAMGVVFEAHSEARLSAAVCALCNTRCQGGGSDVLAPPPPVAPGAQGADAFECQSCQRAFPAARFAAHMDKCMGLSSRRAATRRGTETVKASRSQKELRAETSSLCSRSAANSAASTPAQATAGSYDSSSEHSADRKRKLAKRARRVRGGD